MRVEMANKLPPAWIQSRHGCGQHLAWIDRHRGHSDAILNNIIPMPVCNVGVEAHVHDVPDCGIIDAHLEGRIVRVDEAVDLRQKNDQREPKAMKNEQQ